jgi:hypothetical protein
MAVGVEAVARVARVAGVVEELRAAQGEVPEVGAVGVRVRAEAAARVQGAEAAARPAAVVEALVLVGAADRVAVRAGARASPSELPSDRAWGLVFMS